MKKIMVTIVLVFMFAFGYEAAKSMADHMTPLSGGTSDVSNLTGKTVKNFQGDDLGTISEFVKGPEGRIAFAILSYRVTDNTRKMIAVPIGALSCGEQYCVLNASRETVGTTPPFVSMDDLAKTRTAVNIYLYFGVQPYWTEELTQGKK
jgi:PRC-barrel domain protein